MSFPLLDRRLEGAEVEDELGRLTATFNNLLDRIEGSLAMQRNFVANASHELRTPLTVIQGQLDVLLLKSRSEAEYKAKISSVLDDIRNLTNISNRLLMLAQADSEYPARLFGKVAVDDLLWRCQAEIQGRNPKAVIHITLEEELMEAEHLEVQGNEELLKSVVQNLMENAVKYSPAQEAFVSLKSTAERVLFEVRDQGIGIPEDELEQVFQPFFRSSNVKEIKGHGIGLSLVERIVRLHKGDIKVKSKAGRGTTFSVRLPRGF
jgi:signal transduction histidine kinase